MTKKKPLTCKYCKKKFYHSAKSAPIGRLRKHIAKAHPKQSKAIAKKAQRTSRNKLRPLDHELMAIDDILLSNVLGRQQQPTSYDAVHEQLGGLVLEALVPILVGALTKRIQKGRKKK